MASKKDNEPSTAPPSGRESFNLNPEFNESVHILDDAKIPKENGHFRRLRRAASSMLSLLTPKARPAATASAASYSPPKSAQVSYTAATDNTEATAKNEATDKPGAIGKPGATGKKSYKAVYTRQLPEYWLGRLTSLRSRVMSDTDIAWTVATMDKAPGARQAELLIWKLCFVRLEEDCHSDEALASLKEFRYSFVQRKNLPQLAGRNKWFKEKGDGDTDLAFKIDNILGNGPRVL
ncbi:MAG: hypothetical protein M1831_007405 [Alyxoria varia]|nr:MAG: hypothetical protein M1831_007405 [Alyxoria varia]